MPTLPLFCVLVSGLGTLTAMQLFTLIYMAKVGKLRLRILELIWHHLAKKCQMLVCHRHCDQSKQGFTYCWKGRWARKKGDCNGNLKMSSPGAGRWWKEEEQAKILEAKQDLLLAPWGCKESDMTEWLSLHFTSLHKIWKSPAKTPLRSWARMRHSPQSLKEREFEKQCLYFME